uniref:Protein phosphatase n=1 Tax=Globisporangium ultimum (strain ATCC 200006 / CBS 805.95 / DAOM BR144) TaxID=431595 RepID=K3X4J2_GLOUD
MSGGTDVVVGAPPGIDTSEGASRMYPPPTAAPRSSPLADEQPFPLPSHSAPLVGSTDGTPEQTSPSDKSAFPFKRRAASFNDRYPFRSSSAKTAVANAFANVSSRTTERFAKFRSISSDNFMKKAAPISHSWKVNMNDLARRAKEAAVRAKTNRYQWESNDDAVQFVSGAFEYHGEDAGAVSSYFHIVADGVSSPFGRNSLAQITYEPVSSALIANELVAAVQQALEDITNKNTTPLDVKSFESVVVDAIKTTRIKCFQHRQSRVAATLSVSYFDKWNGKLLTFSLGDSKCIVVRQGEIVHETMAVLRDFNVPSVVNLTNQVTASDYVVQSFVLQEQDICMTFSDGIGDNLYKEDIIDAVKEMQTGLATLQQVCDSLVAQSQMKISIERARELAAADNDSMREDGNMPLDNDVNRLSCSVARISIHNRPVQGFFPFATAAALEYRARALEECIPEHEQQHSKGSVDHLACSLSLYEQHKTRNTLDRQLVVRKPNRRRHYSLLQLKRMAEMRTKKPDDITLFVTHFS